MSLDWGGDQVSRVLFHTAGTLFLALLAILGTGRSGSTETMSSALVRAYQNNPQLNAQRANARVIDENVPQALSGYRPKISVTATLGQEYTDIVTGAPGTARLHAAGTTTPYSAGATVTQTIYNGFQTANRTRAAEGQVSTAREALRIMEQTVLLSAATAYMDVLRDTATLEIQRTNVRVLEEILAQTRERFSAREVTRTDVAQAEAQLAAGRSAVAAAESILNTSRANYRAVVGTEPINLAPGSPADRYSPPALGAAIEAALMENPNVTAAMYGIDVAYLQVKINEGALFPNLSIQANAQYASFPQLEVPQNFTTSVIAQLTIPIYQGGSEHSLIRQSKESLAQQRLNLDVVRNQTRQAVMQAWGQVQAAKAQITATRSQINSSKVALDCVREEAHAGLRTTLDVLNAQQALVNARVQLATAERDRVVASYNLLSALGRFSPRVLGLATNVYDPLVHYRQVRDAWAGIRNPDGR